MIEIITVVDANDRPTFQLDLKTAALSGIPQSKVYTLSNVGVSRTGKSLLLNLFISFLIMGGMTRDFVPGECEDKIPDFFRSAASHSSITQRAEVYAIHLRD